MALLRNTLTFNCTRSKIFANFGKHQKEQPLSTTVVYVIITNTQTNVHRNFITKNN